MKRHHTTLYLQNQLSHRRCCLSIHIFEQALSVQDLVDVHLFAGAQAIVQALEQHDCKPALAWCELHQPRLRKLKSKLEFRLCLQVSTVTPAGSSCGIKGYQG